MDQSSEYTVFGAGPSGKEHLFTHLPLIIPLLITSSTLIAHGSARIARAALHQGCTAPSPARNDRASRAVSESAVSSGTRKRRPLRLGVLKLHRSGRVPR